MIQGISGSRKAYGATMRGLCYLSLAIVAFLTFFMLIYVLYRGVGYITPELLLTKPSTLRNTIGILQSFAVRPLPTA